MKIGSWPWVSLRKPLSTVVSEKTSPQASGEAKCLPDSHFPSSLWCYDQEVAAQLKLPFSFLMCSAAGCPPPQMWAWAQLAWPLWTEFIKKLMCLLHPFLPLLLAWGSPAQGRWELHVHAGRAHVPWSLTERKPPADQERLLGTL